MNFKKLISDLRENILQLKVLLDQIKSGIPINDTANFYILNFFSEALQKKELKPHVFAAMMLLTRIGEAVKFIRAANKGAEKQIRDDILKKVRELEFEVVKAQEGKVTNLIQDMLNLVTKLREPVAVEKFEQVDSKADKKIEPKFFLME